MENLEIVKIINEGKTFTDKKGKERKSINYYIVFNGKYIPVRPSFSSGYTSLDLIAKVIVNS